MAKEEVKLFGTWSSPFSQRVLWALKLKGIEYEYVEEDLSNKSNLLLQYNPIHKKIPVLVHNGKPIIESLVILEYIEETWKQYPLLPLDPHERAMTRFWAKFGDDKVLPSLWGAFIKQGKEQEEAIVAAMENLRNLEEELKGKPFFGGEVIGLTDIVLGWIANVVGAFEEVTAVKMVDEERFPFFSAWIENLSNFPTIADNSPPRDKVVSKFRDIREKLIVSATTK